MLALKETEYLGQAGGGAIQERLSRLCGDLLTEVEGRYPRDEKASTPPERVRALRYRIRRRLLDTQDPPAAAQREMLLDDLDRVFTALQAHSYIGDYLTVDPTTDRRAEMIMKLEEDLLGFPVYPVDRSVTVTAGEPIAVSDLLERAEIPAKGGAFELTARLESGTLGHARPVKSFFFLPQAGHACNLRRRHARATAEKIRPDSLRIPSGDRGGDRLADQPRRGRGPRRRLGGVRAVRAAGRDGAGRGSIATTRTARTRIW